MSAAGNTPASSPGSAIQQCMAALGWNQTDLSEVLGVQQSVVSALVNGKRPISLEIAYDLSAAFGNEPEYWLKLETDFRLFSSGRSDDSIARRARLYRAAPVKEMAKRHWIQMTSDINLLEKQVLGFFGVGSLDDLTCPLPHAARKRSYSEANSSERAWMQRVKAVAQMTNANKFSDAALDSVLAQFRGLLKHPESVRHIPSLLADAGVRLVVVEPFPRTRIEGVCVWLDKTSPVIGLSLRIDRLDSLWFTLLHEIWHVKNRDGLLTPPIVDSGLIGEDAVITNEKPESERKADSFAADFLISPDEIENFIARVKPLFAKVRIDGFAARLGISPSIVVGHLHHRGLIPWNQQNVRDTAIKVRDTLTQAALSDGWGQTLPAAS